MSHSSSHVINISYSELVANSIITQYYALDTIQDILIATLDYINNISETGISLPYFEELTHEIWLQKSKELNVYLTDLKEGRELNLEARGKDYATNILSYPSELPSFILDEMPNIPLGELVICHDVVVQQAQQQNKPVNDHVTHLLVHGILHLIGFDHELGQSEQDEMEDIEINILSMLNIQNPYEAR